VAGDRLPSVRHLAAALGINLHTVRSAYRNLEEDGLVETRHGSGTFVLPRDPGRPGPRGSKVPSSTFGIVVPAHTDLYRRIIDGAESIAHDAPALLFVGSARESEVKCLQIVERMIGRGVDGIVVTAPLMPEQEGARLAGSFGRLVFCDWPGGPRPRVLFDLEAGVAAAVRHLAGHGHRRVGLVVTPAEWPNASPIHRGFRRGLAESDLPQGQIAIVYDYTAEAGHRAADDLFADPDPPTAVVTANDVYAVGILRTARKRGIGVPDDLAVVGTGDHEIGRIVEPTLTTILLPAERMGREALQMVLDLSAGRPPEPGAVELDCPLLVRGSCGCP
jgi:LacI family repressor for deo operon, udp, cdd, tsx, nupC, and nupG